MSSTVLVVVAHPDDETFGCGGTIARLTDDGVRVVVAVLTNGVGSRYAPSENNASLEASTAAARRWTAAIAASHLLGVTDLVQLDVVVRDNEADAITRLKLTRAVEAILKAWSPTQVITHAAGDLNVDHRRLHEAVLTAARPLPGNTVREIYACEVPSSTEWGTSSFRPGCYVDIGDVFARKLKAISCYGGEAPPSPHPRSVDAVTALARWRGANVGLSYAEAFEVVRIIR